MQYKEEKNANKKGLIKKMNVISIFSYDWRDFAKKILPKSFDGKSELIL